MFIEKGNLKDQSHLLMSKWALLQQKSFLRFDFSLMCGTIPLMLTLDKSCSVAWLPRINA